MSKKNKINIYLNKISHRTDFGLVKIITIFKYITVKHILGIELSCYNLIWTKYLYTDN